MNARSPAIRQRFVTVAASLAVFAVVLRCLVAPGLMPDLKAAAAGDFKLVICSAGGAKTISAPTGDQPSDDHPEGSPFCPFAAFGHFATIPAPVIVTPIAARPALEVAEARDMRVAPLPRPISARGPPALS